MHPNLNSNHKAPAKSNPAQYQQANQTTGDHMRQNNYIVSTKQQQQQQSKSNFYLTSNATTKARQQIHSTNTSSNDTSLQSKITASLPIINAPTSLANLAQLSGITLLPINNINQQTDLNQTGHHNKYQLSNSTPRQSTSNFINNNNANITQHHQNKISTGNQFTKSSNNLISKQQSYNLNSIPSIHLLNHQISTTEAIQSWRQKSSASLELEDQLQYSNNYNQRPPKKNGKKGNLHNSNTNQTFNPQQLQNDVSVIPLNEGHLPSLSDISDTNLTRTGGNYDDILSQTGLDSNPIDNCGDLNEDSNNISLAKLMAILNNPALTITAVDPSQNPNTKFLHNDYNEHHQRATSTPKNILDKQQISISIPTSLDSTDSYRPINEHPGNKRLQSDFTRSSKSRIPQSAANIQVMQGKPIDSGPLSSTRNLSCSQGSGNSIANERLNIQPLVHKQPDLQQNWLPHIGSDITLPSSAGACQLLSWSNDNLRADELRSNERLDDPTMLSTSVRNLMMQQLPSGSKNTTVSVQLMKHIANQAKDNNWSNSQTTTKSVLEPECILTTVPKPVQQLSQGAKRMESSKTVTSSTVQKKTYKEPLQTTKNRLYIARTEHVVPGEHPAEFEKIFNLNSIDIGGTEEREVHLSERHHMLDVMMSSRSKSKQKSAIPEPDEIFINRSKRVMSKIDTMVERKKRRRFERICGRVAPKTNNLEEQCMESENEWSGDENINTESACFIKTQLPLEESETEEKRNHLMSVGLVSRYQRNNLLVEQCEEKMKIFSPLALEGIDEVSKDIQRFVDTMVKTGGDDIQLRIDSSIKRNDLPLLEGLNRNTSRLKMSYMNVLGLEKRSKRTTLYKIKPNENNLNITNAPKQNDLIKTNNDLTSYEKVKFDQDTSRTYGLNGRSVVQQNTPPLPAKQVASLTSCREAMKPQSKNEYMKSLGLMAS